MVPAPDLSRLNDAERQVLALLADGHTAKSIAAETGRSVAAVNERLREARRKTGIGSSRELARLFRAQESRDDKVGVAPRLPPAPTPPRAPLRVRRQGLLLMIIVPAVLAAALLLLSPQTATLADDPLFAEAAGDQGGSTWALHARLAAEMREVDWAARAEAALINRYGNARWVDGGVLRVRCGATLCEVLGRSERPLAGTALKQAGDAVQSSALRADLAKQGLAGEATGLHVEKGVGGQRFSFVSYWRRIAG